MSLRRCHACPACMYGDASDPCESPVDTEAAPVACEDPTEDDDLVAEQYFSALSDQQEQRHENLSTCHPTADHHTENGLS